MQGSLTLNEDGGVIINLDHAVWKWIRSGNRYPGNITDKFDVVGLLTAKNLYIRLQDTQLRTLPNLSNNGGTTLGSYVILLSTLIVPGQQRSSYIKRLTIPLGELWPWLNRPMAKLSRHNTKTVVHYPLDINDEFKIKNGSVSVHTRTNVPHDMAKRNVAVQQEGWIDFQFDVPISLTEAKDIYRICSPPI